MVIQVILQNKRIVAVDHFRLTAMIDSNEILALRREEGWAIIGKVPVRSRQVAYSGTERRHS